MTSLPVTREAYKACLGQDFIVTRPDGEQAVFNLESVETSIDDEVQCCFSLFFRAPDTATHSGIYRISHPQLGEFALSLELILRRRVGLRYQAVFNLLRDPVLESPRP